MTIRILLIDDHAVVRAGLHSVLGAELDLEVVGEAANGLAGINLARELRPDIVITDLLLPDTDGVTVAQTLCGDLPQTQVIILTGLSDGDTSVVRALRAGAIGYVSKNGDLATLLETIRLAAHGQVRLSPLAAARIIQEMRSPKQHLALTEREREVLREVAIGRSNKQIARSLNIAVTTVKCHVRVILDKLGVESRTQAALRAIHLEIFSSEDLQAA